MKRIMLLAFGVFSFWLALLNGAQARTICTIVADANSGAILHEEGDCSSRVTPASTFKIPLAAMGYDTGFLTDTEAPVIPFRHGYADWGGAAWKQPATPLRWMRHSIVWYSQQIAHELGVERLSAYASAFGYGNADFSGDPGMNNALERAWISSSLKISPREQLAFLRRLVLGQLPVSTNALHQTTTLVEYNNTADGWTVHGKTGSAYPRREDRSFDRTRGWGWFVGWASRGDTTLIFARLDQDERRHDRPGGLRAREALLAEWPSLARVALSQ